MLGYWIICTYGFPTGEGAEGYGGHGRSMDKTQRNHTRDNLRVGNQGIQSSGGRIPGGSVRSCPLRSAGAV